MTLTLVPGALHDLSERERRIKIMVQLTQRPFFRDIAIAKWRMARNNGAGEDVIERLGHWVSSFYD